MKHELYRSVSLSVRLCNYNLENWGEAGKYMPVYYFTFLPAPDDVDALISMRDREPPYAASFMVHIGRETRNRWSAFAEYNTQIMGNRAYLSNFISSWSYYSRLRAARRLLTAK